MKVIMFNIKAVLFDMDGVLVDAREWHYDSLNKALGLFGYKITREEHECFYDGLPTHIKLKKLSEDKGLPESLHKFINQMKQQYTVDAIYNNSTPDFAKQVMLRKLRKMGLKIGVCSNSITNSIELMLKKSLIYDYFDLVISNEDIKNPKPAPDMYIKAMEKLSCRPEEVIIIEDSPHGIEAAQKSGGNLIIVKDATEVHWGIFKNFFK